MKIAICCSSSDDIDERYKESSRLLLENIFKKENDLVFGAMNNGIMGIAYQTAKKYNRDIIGIAPEMYKDDFKSLECNTEILTQNVNERTSALINNSDALVFLPGGIGTLYELMSAIEMKRSKEFEKPIIIHNETGFFDEMLQMLDKVYSQRFTGQSVRLSYNVTNDYMTAIELLNKLNVKQKEKIDNER